MPVMDGYAATRAIRDLPEGKEVKIIAVTASAFEEQSQEILDAGCDDKVSKPVREEEMLAAIGRHLGIKYEYADVVQETATETMIELSREMLVALPKELLEELRHAALVLDRSSLSGLIERIAVDAPDTAKALKTLVDTFQFGKIQNLLREIE